MNLLTESILVGKLKSHSIKVRARGHPSKKSFFIEATWQFTLFFFLAFWPLMYIFSDRTFLTVFVVDFKQPTKDFWPVRYATAR